MKYNNILKGTFIFRPNRFIAMVDIDGAVHTCHVKNTGRCRELLVKGATVILQESDNPLRKTKYDLISVYKDERLVNMDSQAPNKIFAEHIPKLFSNVTFVRPETAYGDSRFDFYIEAEGKKIFAEVKGVTLEVDNKAMFPDAPTERGVKHINELCKAVEEGYEAYIVFIIQMSGIKSFSPNDATHPLFGDALRQAQKMGVNIIALDCDVTEEEVIAQNIVSVKL